MLRKKILSLICTQFIFAMNTTSIKTMKNQIISVGSQFPDFKKLAVVSLDKDNELYEISSEDHRNAGQWLVMFWWPKDFTFVCPTEIAEFNKRYSDFSDRDAQLIGAST